MQTVSQGRSNRRANFQLSGSKFRFRVKLRIKVCAGGRSHIMSALSLHLYLFLQSEPLTSVRITHGISSIEPRVCVNCISGHWTQDFFHDFTLRQCSNMLLNISWFNVIFITCPLPTCDICLQTAAVWKPINDSTKQYFKLLNSRSDIATKHQVN